MQSTPPKMNRPINNSQQQVYRDAHQSHGNILNGFNVSNDAEFVELDDDIKPMSQRKYNQIYKSRFPYQTNIE